MACRFAILAVAALALAPAAAPSATTSGLRGTVWRSPSTPVCRADTPCRAPAYVGLVFTRAGSTPVRVHTSRAGVYRVTLRSGIYTVATSLTGLGHTPKPKSVHVRVGVVDRLDFTIDTGIR